MHVYCNDCFNFLSINAGWHFFQTHWGEQFHHLLNFPSLGFQRSFLIFTCSFQSFCDLLGPYSLNSDQGHLGRISSDKFSHLGNSGIGADFACLTNNIFHSLLHFLLETAEPSFNWSFTFLIISQSDCFFVTTHNLSNCTNNFFVWSFLFGVFVKCNFVNCIEKFLEIFLNGLWFRSLR